MEYTYQITLGDPLNDGHGKYEKIKFKTNKTKEETVEAYLKSCKLTGLRFHHLRKGDRSNELFCEYEQAYLTKYQIEVLSIHNCPFEEFFDMSEDDLLEDTVLYNDGLFDLIMWFISLSLPDLEYEVIQDKIETINLNCKVNGVATNLLWGYGTFE